MSSGVNKQELARLQGVSLPTVTKWIADDCPVEQEGGRGKDYVFDNAKVTAWRIEREAKRKLAQAEDESEGSAKARKMRAEADIAEMKAEEKRGSLVSKEAVVEAMADEIARARARLLSLPVRAAPLVVGMTEIKARELMDDLVREALDELSMMPEEEQEQKESEHLHSGRFCANIAYDVEQVCDQPASIKLLTVPSDDPRTLAGVVDWASRGPGSTPWGLSSILFHIKQ